MLQFFEEHAPIWAADPAAIGLTLDQCNSLTAAVAEASAKHSAAYQARQSSKAATVDQNDALTTLAELGAQLIKIIRAFAIQTGDPGVFAAAQIPEPKTPEPIAPVNPSAVRFELQTDGSLLVKWDGVKSNGTTFVVQRSVVPGPGEPSTGYSNVASVGEKSFVDTTIPAGAVSATYVIRALKGGQMTTGSAPATAQFVYGGNNGQMELSLAA
ncbi:MAG: hypothetical protein ACF8R7_07385 [Phycisphaerales bacterium JB039]